MTGSDPSGVLYGELELADRIRAAKALPAGHRRHGTSGAEAARNLHRHAEAGDHLRRRRVRLSLHAAEFSVLLRQGRVDQVSRHAGRGALQHALSCGTAIRSPAC